MHPRNPYETPPNFNVLADAFPPLRKFVHTADKAQPVLDFKDPDAQRTLTQALLHRDFGLSIDIPEDRIIPPVPNRLNYVLWIQDLVQALQLADTLGGSQREEPVYGVDIGTGASAIYTLLSCRVEPNWSMIGTEIDLISAKCAQSNVATNKLQSSIQIQTPQHGDEKLFFPIHCQSDTNFTFTMCNPPFYTSEDAMQRSEAQKAVAPRAILTASNNELISAGGEVAFVSRMIQESLDLRKRCRWFTSMLGHLSSLTPLVEILRSHGIDNHAIGELVQGRTRRWVIGWSFSNVRLPDTVARINNPTIHSLQPPRNTLLYPMAPKRVHTEGELNSIIKHACHMVPDHCMWSLPIPDHTNAPALPSITQPSPHAGFLISLQADTWSRAARRKAKQVLSTTTDGHVSTDALPALACRLSWTAMSDDPLFEVDWVQGEDRLLFESFASHIVAKVRTVL